ncbi:ABC transporter ATP-binding protein [Halobellus inordinatus]|uniref:ABC transporter ATP-binding protein n=1 Tax=Halobellus inordinatus TaxID=1126236 RepID=UPI0021148C73|nr:ABC transporter ATP-binding protein [Halobellus ramosii]
MDADGGDGRAAGGGSVTTGPESERSTTHSADVGAETNGSRRSADDTDVASGSAPLDDHADVAVAVEGLSKQFGTGSDAITVVDSVSFEIEPGSVVGLLGPNGAGKTTLIKSILGMVLPDEGSVRICGVDVPDRPRAAYGHVDAMLEGARNDYWRLTVRENLRYFATIGGIDPDSVADRHERLLERLELADKVDVAVRNLSRGMKQKVSLASTLAGDADVIFLDEPTLGLDVESSRTLQRELRRLAEDRGLTVILSSHDMDVVEAVCDRVLIMSGGRIVADDSVDALLGRGERHGVRIASGDFDADLLADLRAAFDVTGVERFERRPGARVDVTTDSDGLYALMARLEKQGVRIDRLTAVDPDLEDVFVDLTSDRKEETEDQRWEEKR